MPFDGSLSERLPTPDESAKAKYAASILAKIAESQTPLSLRLNQNDDGEAVIELPSAVSKIVLELLLLISKGEAVTLVPFGAELTTQQSADLLNVSRPFLIKLLNDEEMPHHKVGAHRRIQAEDVFNYKKRRDAKREKALQKLADLGQEIDAE